MMFKDNHEPSNPLFQYLNILPLKLNIKLQQGKLINKLI